MLGGFIIRRFLGAWTLVIKSLGLVRRCSLTNRTLANLQSVSSRGIWHVVGERGASRPCCLLLRKHFHEIVWEYKQQ